MKKVLLISDYLVHYRIEMFESLCDKIDLTIAHSSNLPTSGFKFSVHKIALKSKGPFIDYEHLPNFNDFDVVIFEFKLISWSLYKSLFSKRNYKLFVFGIGVAASYKKHYDQDKAYNDIIRKYILKEVDGAIFYDRYPFSKWISKGIDPEKLSISYNTVPYDKEFYIKDKTFESFIFIGTLYKQKKIFDLLTVYKKTFNKYGDKTPTLEIVGGGEEYEKVGEWIKKEELEHKIIMHGQINDENILRPIFSRAIACISPGQAGLSVQKCFSYGVPFITSYNAITGGEISSIIEGETGFFYNNSIQGLEKVFDKIMLKEVDISEMSTKCYVFYKNFRSVEIWKKGFIENIIR